MIEMIAWRIAGTGLMMCAIACAIAGTGLIMANEIAACSKSRLLLSALRTECSEGTRKSRTDFLASDQNVIPLT